MSWLPGKVGYGGIGKQDSPIAVQVPLTPVLVTWGATSEMYSSMQYVVVREGGGVDTERVIELLGYEERETWDEAISYAKRLTRNVVSKK